MKLFPDARILEIDLGKKEIKTRSLPGEIYRQYPGGSALGVYLLMHEMDPIVDALSPENPLIFSVSALTGLPMSGLSRMVVTTKSPLTGTIGDSQAGGFFPVHMKGNGYDSIIIKGKSNTPAYVYINGDDIQIKDASKIWGLVTGEAESAIRADLGVEKVEIAQIGPGGENLVKFACILNMCNRANGRNGTGAVMGSKNLKAIVVKKTKPQKAYDADQFKALAASVKKKLDGNPSVAGLGKYGTAGDLQAFSDEGFLPTNNWTKGYFPEGSEAITGETMYDTVLKERDTCFACAVKCKRVVEIPGLVDPLYGGPEYETVATFGSYCGITTLDSICHANQLCNMYGLDTISCGATIAFAMECYEKGLLTSEDTDGIELRFGNGDALAPVIKKIATREGIGELLAKGSKKASEEIGHGAEDLFIGVKGQEFPAHMPQYKPAVGMVYAVNSFGADHQSSEHDPFLVMPADSQERVNIAKIGMLKGYEDPYVIDDDKVRFAFDSQCFFSTLDTLCLCQFVWGPSWELFGPDEMVELCKYGIGWETSLFELMRIGERRINMMRQFNAIAGFTKADDKLPKRIFEPMPEGPSKGIQLDEKKFKEALELYYEFAGWDKKTGNPTPAVLRKLSLGWLVKE
jgi:aldehyde:ferredoxin oxidoreductase